MLLVYGAGGGCRLRWGSAWQTGQKFRLRAEEWVALHLLQCNLHAFFWVLFVLFYFLTEERRRC